jgi:hypothetical protein
VTASPAHRTQGSLVAVGDPVLEEIKKRYPYTWREDARWIVTTHECCFESDQVTSLEVMQATYTDHEPDSWAQTGQSARQIALPFGEGWLLVESDRRVVLRKTKKQRGKVGLEDFLIDDTRFEVFKNWLGHRYSRPALPDKVSESLSNRGINRGMADLLRERRETYRVLITGHEGADESGDAVIGISLVILLDGSELVGPPYDAEREAWLDKVRSLNWATDSPGDQGVALDEVRFDSAREMSVAEFAQYGVVDFEFISNSYTLERETHAHGPREPRWNLSGWFTAMRNRLPFPRR